MEKQFEPGLVSVITPVYNAEKYIETAIEAVLKQTYQNIEMILVDDCSTDSSAQIIERIRNSHSNIVYFKQETNQGAGVARNKALELARGQYVAFLDSDDIWLPNKVERQLNLMHETGSPFAYAAIDMINENGEQIKPKRKIKETCDYKYLLHNTIIATSSVIIDRTVLGDFRMSLRRGGQDYATWLKLLRGNVTARGINEVLVRYRVLSNSLSSNKLKSVKQVWQIQTQDERINNVFAFGHTICFIINALKKYLIS